jgi:hypothetical protein
MKKRILQYSLTKITLAAVAAAVALLTLSPARADTSWAHGSNWASFGDYLTNNGIMFPAGISNTTTVAQAKAVADTVACDDKGLGINFVRIPVDPATVNYNWTIFTNCVNELLAQGLTVDICCWYNTGANQGGGVIPSIQTW